jgi:hypothetical protein
VAQGVGPEFKPQYWEKKKKKQGIMVVPTPEEKAISPFLCLFVLSRPLANWMVWMVPAHIG